LGVGPIFSNLRTFDLEVIKDNIIGHGGPYPFTRWSVDLLREHLRRHTHIDVSYSTVYHTLKRLDYRYGRPKLDLKHRQDPNEVTRAKRQKRTALKKRKPAPVVVLSRIVTKPSST
jgi:hypothetical protein